MSLIANVPNDFLKNTITRYPIPFVNVINIGNINRKRVYYWYPVAVSKIKIDTPKISTRHITTNFAAPTESIHHQHQHHMM